MNTVVAPSNFVRVIMPSSSTTSSTWTNMTSTSMGTGTIFVGTANALYSVQDQDDFYNNPLVRDALRLSGECSVADGETATIKMPDGSVIDVQKDGSFTIDDKDSKVIYRANRIRDFNPFINVSDRMEDFIAFCNEHGVRQGELLELPLKLFIGWLVIKAAEADHEPAPDVKLLPDLRQRRQPRCPSCGRFTRIAMRAKRIEFCAPACFSRHFDRSALAIAGAA